MQFEFSQLLLQGNVKPANCYKTLKPQERLTPLVQYFWRLQIPSGQYKYRVIPDNCVDLVFNYRNLEDCYIFAPLKAFKTMTIHGSTKYFGIRFNLLGHEQFISKKIGDWNVNDSEILAKSLLSKNLLQLIFRSINDSCQFTEACREIEQILLNNQLNRDVDTRLIKFVEHCYSNIDSAIDLSDKKCLEIGISSRQLRRLVNRQLGLSPQVFFNVLRFQKIIANNFYSLNHNFQELYFDQSHFIRNFKKLSGLAPNEFMKKSVLYNNE